MTPEHLAILFFGGIAAGVIGSIFGLGGGIVMVPLLVLILKVPIHYAVATSLLCVIATSSAVGSRNVQRGMTNLRLVSVLEVATVIGAICGGAIAGTCTRSNSRSSSRWCFRCWRFPWRSAGRSLWKHRRAPRRRFRRPPRGDYYDPALGHEVHYDVERLPVAMGVSAVAGHGQRPPRHRGRSHQGPGADALLARSGQSERRRHRTS